MHKLVNGELVAMTDAEIAAREAEDNPVPSIAALKSHAALRRWRAETGGVVLTLAPGVVVRVPTDDRAKLLILGAAQTVAPDSTSPLVIDGQVFGPLTGAQFVAINAAVVAHVQATFPVLAGVLAAIDAGTITTLAQIDAAAWPQN